MKERMDAEGNIKIHRRNIISTQRKSHTRYVFGKTRVCKIQRVYSLVCVNLLARPTPLRHNPRVFFEINRSLL